MFSVKDMHRTLGRKSGGLVYFGGPVISNVKVYAVFWGDTVNAETQQKIGPFFANMLDSTYMDWLSEYDTNIQAVDGRQGTGQHIGRGSFAGSVTLHPANAASALTDTMIQQELDAQIAAGALPPSDENTLYMVYFPKGVSISDGSDRSCSTFCAYHEAFKSATSGASVFYGVMPDCGAGCSDGGSAFDGLTVSSSHECLEAVTDPFPTPGNSPAYPQAWNDTSGEEVGDLCTQGSSTVTGHGTQNTVQWEWDNSIGGCSKGPWAQTASQESREETASVSAQPSPLLDFLRADPTAVFKGL